MELSQLEVFLAVAREGRFSRAAEKLFVQGKGPNPALEDNATGGGNN